MNESNKKTTQDRPEGARVVFRFWRGAALWSVVVFAATSGAAAILWAYLDGRPVSELSGLFGRYNNDREEKPAEVQEPIARRALDGMPVDVGAVELVPFAVAIDNMSDARPQAGLTEASLVIEAPVEAGITRFLAIFPGDAKVSKIGPVRSARPYFVDWAEEYDAVFVHVGGSPEALEKIAKSAVRDLNEYSRGGFFWRDKGRKAPHNTYTSGEQLAAAAAKVWPKPPRPLTPWKYEVDAPLSERPSDVADLVVSSGNDAYARNWRYDRETNDYVRVQNGRDYLDQAGSVVRAKNVVVQFNEVAILDEVGRRRIKTLGEGDAVVASGGKIVKGTWKKSSLDERTQFFSSEGEPVVFNAGTTWIQVVPKGTKLVYE